MRKPVSCKCKNRDTDQLCSNFAADQQLCFCDKDRRTVTTGLQKICHWKTSGFELSPQMGTQNLGWIWKIFTKH